MSNIGLYAKAIGGALASAGTAAITALNDGHINNLEWITIVSAFLVGLGAVWALPEFPVGIAKYLKAISAGAVSGLASLSALLVSGHAFTAQDWINIAVAVIAASGLVHVTKNAVQSETMQQTSTIAVTPVVEDDPEDGEDVVSAANGGDESEDVPDEPSDLSDDDNDVESAADDAPLETK